MKKIKTTIKGHAVTILDYKTSGSARFVAYYDALPATVKGMGGTKAAALVELDIAADAYGTKRQKEIEAEDWAQHESDKADALDRGDY